MTASPTPLDTAHARTLSAFEYTDPTLFQREQSAIFGRTWQLVAHVTDLLRPGDFVPVTVLDEPIVMIRGLDGELRGFYNVCRHRAGQVALTKGNRKSLQCRYHGWTYGLDGALRACPEMEETEDFDKEDFGLTGPGRELGAVRLRQPRPRRAPAHGRAWARSRPRSRRPASTSTG